MQTNAELARNRIDNLVKAVLAGAMVIQAGGNQVDAGDLGRSLDATIKRSLDRLYPSFGDADHPGWATVFARAQQGNSDCLDALGYAGPVAQQPVCKAVLGAVTGVGRQGTEVRRIFESAPYGWPRDAVHGALAALLVSTEITAEDSGIPVQASGLAPNKIGKITFRRETTAIPLPVRLQVRALLGKAKVETLPNEEAAGCMSLLQRLTDLAAAAGGSGPLPPPPSSDLLTSLKGQKGNQLILSVHEQSDELLGLLTTWTRLSDIKSTRVAAYAKAQRLATQLQDVDGSTVHLDQLAAIGDQRRLLDEPDPMSMLITSMSDLLRAALLAQAVRLDEALDRAQDELESDETWSRLTDEQRHNLLAKHGLAPTHRPDLGTTNKVLAAAEARPVSSWNDRVAAVEVRLAQARTEAARLLEPKAVRVSPPTGAMHSEEDIKAYIGRLHRQLTEALTEYGSIII
jgi:hypothetical protein